MAATPRIKYPRTPHLPTSPGATNDDKWLTDDALTHLRSGIDLVVTEKMDGGNVTLAPDYFHARSTSDTTPAWEHRAKAEWAQVRNLIPASWRLSCESMYARRSVGYTDLPGVLLIIGIWNEANSLLPWDETTEWAGRLGLPSVPLLYRGNNFAAANLAWAAAGHTPADSEGYVIRSAGSIPYDQFSSNVGKWVRADHVRTAAAWRHRNDFATNTFL